MAMGDRVRFPQVVTASALYLLALVGIGLLAYGVHKVMVWQNDGWWCRQDEHGVKVRRYGNDCRDYKPKRSSPKLEV